ncbi:hypothetical protein ANN_23151 [Periplaneta americana]|uniref:DUF4817 domain-containing protein n=1 Tax=Periplaneta americana TaxID=6978 RepID=A0ABQ8SKA4_PERAM|nr:hypothetical protein ANN_23151 [Periplaneta americana]
MYTIPERVVLIHVGGLSLREAAEEYHRRHPDQPTPHHGSIGRLMERFKTAGNGSQSITVNQGSGARCGTSQVSVSRVLSVNHFQPYRMHFVQELHGDIRRECAQITPAVLRNMRSSYLIRVWMCRQQNGHQFEH